MARVIVANRRADLTCRAHGAGIAIGAGAVMSSTILCSRLLTLFTLASDLAASFTACSLRRSVGLPQIAAPPAGATMSGCRAELSNAEIGVPGCTAFWNSCSCLRETTGRTTPACCRWLNIPGRIRDNLAIKLTCLSQASEVRL